MARASASDRPPPREAPRGGRDGGQPPENKLVRLQRLAGNRAVSGLLAGVRAGGGPPVGVQRVSAESQVIAALDKADPVAGVGDFPAAFRVLNGLAMFDLLNTLYRLQQNGRAELLASRLPEARDVDVPRLRTAFDALADKNAKIPAAAFAGRHPEGWRALPLDQQTDVATFLDPSWRPSMAIEDIAGAADDALGVEYARGLEGDAERLRAVENELEHRADDLRGWGTAAPGQPPAVGVAGTTAITPDVAIKILENYSQGLPPFKPELGKGGASWFVTEGNPYVGIGADKTITVNAEITGTKGALRFGEAELLALHAQERAACAAEAEAKFREHHRIPPDKPLTNRLQKALDRPNGFKDKFAESRMWDRVGERVAGSQSKVGEVILQNSKFSRQGNGKFLVVADAAKIRLKGGPTAILAQLEGSGLKAEPVLIEAAEAMATKLKWAGRVRTVFRYGGRVMIVVAIAADTYKIYHAQDKTKAVIETAAGWAGATAAAAAFAAWWTPADVAGPWAWAIHGVGTLVSGGVGYWVGSETARTIYELTLE